LSTICIGGNFDQCSSWEAILPWEWLNNPRYPLKFSDLGIRIGVNYVVYAMTH